MTDSTSTELDARLTKFNAKPTRAQVGDLLGYLTSFQETLTELSENIDELKNAIEDWDDPSTDRSAKGDALEEMDAAGYMVLSVLRAITGASDT